MKSQDIRVTAAVALLVTSAACAAPFAEMQSARLAGKGRVELSPSYSHMDYTEDGESAKIQDVFGLHAATGVGDRLDVRLRVDHIRVEQSGGAGITATALGVGPKYSLVRDWVALFAPIGFAFGRNIEVAETWQFHPSLILTVPAARFIDFNASLKALIPLTSDDEGVNENSGDVLAALTVGLGLGPDLSRWVIRPEVGIMKNPRRTEGTIRHFSLGATFFLGNRND